MKYLILSIGIILSCFTSQAVERRAIDLDGISDAGSRVSGISGITGITKKTAKQEDEDKKNNAINLDNSIIAVEKSFTNIKKNKSQYNPTPVRPKPIDLHEIRQIVHGKKSAILNDFCNSFAKNKIIYNKNYTNMHKCKLCCIKTGRQIEEFVEDLVEASSNVILFLIDNEFTGIILSVLLRSVELSNKIRELAQNVVGRFAHFGNCEDEIAEKISIPKVDISNKAIIIDAAVRAIKRDANLEYEKHKRFQGIVKKTINIEKKIKRIIDNDNTAVSISILMHFNKLNNELDNILGINHEDNIVSSGTRILLSDNDITKKMI